MLVLILPKTNVVEVDKKSIYIDNICWESDNLVIITHIVRDFLTLIFDIHSYILLLIQQKSSFCLISLKKK